MSTESEVVAVASNEIWRRRHTLSVPEQRLLVWAIAQVKQGDKGFEPVRLTIDEYAKMTDAKSGNFHAQMQEVVIGNEGIMRRVIAIPDGSGGWTAFNWLLDATYKNGVIEMTLHPHLAPYVLQLKERFASVPLLPTMRLRGGYALAFFEFCCSWYGSRTKGWEMTVSELREWLQIKDGVFVRIGHLQTRLIDLAKKELDRKCPVSFMYDSLKEGRKIVGWRFTVVDNKPTEQPKKKGKVKAPAEATELDGNARDKRHKRARNSWLNASAEQRASWLLEMPHAAILAPKQEGDEPRAMFLEALSKVLEPELPL